MKEFEKWYGAVNPVTTAADTPLWYYDLKNERAIIWKAALEWAISNPEHLGFGDFRNGVVVAIEKELEE